MTNQSLAGTAPNNTLAYAYTPKYKTTLFKIHSLQNKKWISTMDYWLEFS